MRPQDDRELRSTRGLARGIGQRLRVVVPGLTALLGVLALHCGARFIDAVDLVMQPSGSSDASPTATATPAPDFIWYVLDETQGTTAKDSSPHHYDITNLNGVAWAQGANFDGVSTCGFTPVDASYRDPPITISAWLTPLLRADETTTQYGLYPYPPNAIGDDEPGTFGYGIGLNVWTDGDAGSALAAEDVDVCQDDGPLPHACLANDNAGGAGPFLAGHEYFVVMTIGSSKGDDGGGDAGPAAPFAAHVYVNGAPFDDTTALDPGNIAQTTLYLGCHNTDTAYGSKRLFAGRIRDARVYKRELGPTEVAQLYTDGPTVHAPAPIAGDATAD